MCLLLMISLVHSNPINSKMSSGPASNTSKNGASLDTAQVKKNYMNGDFDPAVETLTKVLKSNQTMTHADSVFAFKYLGVIYAASYETREKGKFYMRQLLLTEPGIGILDMYASDTIYMIFKNIQDELAQTQRNAPPSNGNGSPTSESSTKKAPSKMGYWIGGSVIIVAGTLAYFALSSTNQSETVDHSFKF